MGDPVPSGETGTQALGAGSGYDADVQELAAYAARVVGAPVALVTLLGEDTQTFLANVGFAREWTSLEESFCATAVLQEGVFEVPDAASDPRFRDNPLVTGEPGVRFYAGVPVRTGDGQPTNALCVLDTSPRTLTDFQRDTLALLGRQVEARLALKRQTHARERERERFTEILNLVPAFTALLDGSDLRFAFANGDYRELVGKREVLGLSVREALPEIEGQGFFELLDGVMATGEPTGGREVAVRIQRNPEGPAEERFIDFLYQAVYDDGEAPSGVLVHGVDVTDHVLARRRSDESGELFRTVFQQAPDDAIVVTDAERRVTAWNPAAERVCGWSAQEAVGELIDRIFTEEDRTSGEMLGETKGAAANGKAPDERWHLRKDGSRFWGSGTMNSLHDETGAVTGYLKVFRDGTERHEEAAALGFLRRLADATIDLRDPNEIVRLAERALGERLNANRVVYGEFEEDEERFAVRFDWVDGVGSLAGDHRLDGFGSRIGENLRGGRIDVVRDREAELAGDEGGLIALRAGETASAVTVPVRRNGRMVGIFAVNGVAPRDWTQTEVDLVQQVGDRLAAEIERGRAESLLRDANETLEARVEGRTVELQKAVQEAEGFNYAISHDLRTPLRAIVSTSRILLEEAGPELSFGHRDLLDRQAHNADRLGQLIDALLKLSRLSRVELSRRRVDMTHEAVAAAQMHDGCEVLVQAGMVADGDPGLLASAWQNLIENACKFSPNGGTVRAGQEGGAFFVRDEGVGFDMRFAEKLFLPFERLVRDDEFPGLGIGLANVQRVVQRHGGRIWAESEPDRGATFWFTLSESE